MLRSASNARLSPSAWALVLAAIFAHTDAIVRMMRIDGPGSIGLLEALSLLAWTLAVLACFICIERKNRVGSNLRGRKRPGMGIDRAHPALHGSGGPAVRCGRHRLAPGIPRPAAAYAAAGRPPER